jgi:uncharacterized cupin superfamily protein
MSAKEELAELHQKKNELEVRIAEIYAASVNAPAEEKVCDNWMAEMLGRPVKELAFPLSISGITHGKRSVIDHSRKNVGEFVAVRPVDKALEGKTFLGVYIGDIALEVGSFVNSNTGVMELQHFMHNPAIWVPDLKRVIFGCGSWWGVLKSPDDLKQITSADINDIWYVKAMHALMNRTDSTNS